MYRRRCILILHFFEISILIGCCAGTDWLLLVQRIIFVEFVIVAVDDLSPLVVI